MRSKIICGISVAAITVPLLFGSVTSSLAAETVTGVEANGQEIQVENEVQTDDFVQMEDVTENAPAPILSVSEESPGGVSGQKGEGESDHGSMRQIGWIVDEVTGKKCFYYDESGNQVFGWKNIDGSTYYFDKTTGIMRIGWFNNPDNNEWYYFESDGKIAKNVWKRDSHGWCYLGKDGRMVKNSWAKDSKGWCWMGPNGYWVKSKWIQSGGQWYYLKSNGYMAANEWAKDSKGWCWMNGNGKITKSKWIKSGGYWYYLKSNGYMAANEWAKDSKGWCWMNGSGKIAKSKWIKSKNIWYYLNKKGYMVTGEQVINKTTYYFQSSGAYIGRKYPSLASVGINYNSSVNTKVDAVIKDMLTQCLKAGATFDSDLDPYQQACIIVQYVGARYSYGDGSYTAESMIDKGYGTCYAYSDLTYCIARKVGLSNSWLTVPGKNVNHDGKTYGSQHRTVVAQIKGNWYDLDANGISNNIDLMYAFGLQPSKDLLEPEKISQSYAQYLLGKSKTYNSIH